MDKATQFLNELAQEKAAGSTKGVTVTLNAATLAILNRWKVGKSSIKDTASKMIEVAAATLTEMQEQKPSQTASGKTSATDSTKEAWRKSI